MGISPSSAEGISDAFRRPDALAEALLTAPDEFQKCYRNKKDI
jgi:hypothetical protein